MQVTEAQAKKIAEKLDSEFLAIHPLALGAHNLNFLLETTTGKYVLRIAPRSRQESIHHEYTFLKRLKGKYGPKAILYDGSQEILSQDFLIEEYIVGKHPTIVSDDFLLAMAQFYTRLHEDVLCSPTDAFEKGEYSLYNPFARWVKIRYDAHKHLLSADWLSRIESLMVRVEKIVLREDNLFAQRKCFSIVQRDPSPKNIFLTEQGIRLVDWEFVRYDAPEWDLVAFIWAWELSSVQTQTFLRAYGFSDAKRILDILLLVHISMMLAWRVERLCKIRSGHIPEGFTHGNEEKIIEDFSWILPQIEALEEKLRS